MGAMISKVLHIVFALTLAVNMMWCAALMKVVGCLPLKKLTRQGLCCMVVQAAWSLAIMLAPWMWCSPSNDTAQQWKLMTDALAETNSKAANGEGEYRPLFILGNHASFFDTVLAGARFPASVLWRCRTYMDNNLFNLPILSTVCRSIGHFPVHFTSGEDGKFTIDKAKGAEVDLQVDEHLKAGGWLCFFPEGQMNKQPDEIMPFRYGGIKKALAFDARLQLFVSAGNTTVWPKKALVGGFPGRVAYSSKALAPQGAKALLAELRSNCTPEQKDMKDEELLGTYARNVMQKEYDLLKSSKPSGVVSFLMSSSPAVVFYLALGVSLVTKINALLGKR